MTTTANTMWCVLCQLSGRFNLTSLLVGLGARGEQAARPGGEERRLITLRQKAASRLVFCVVAWCGGFLSSCVRVVDFPGIPQILLRLYVTI